MLLNKFIINNLNKLRPDINWSQFVDTTEALEFYQEKEINRYDINRYREVTVLLMCGRVITKHKKQKT